MFLRLAFPRCAAWSLVSSGPRFRHSRFYSVASEWKGSSHSTSEFVTHVLAGDDSPTVECAIASALDTDDVLASDSTQSIPLDNTFLKPRHYLQLGSVWFLPADAPRDPSNGQKPIRLSDSDLKSTLEEGDYLRVHHSPRRFPLVYNYNWTLDREAANDKPGVIVERNDEKGYWVVDKPGHVPVHPTVDNCLENVAEMIRQARIEQGEADVYVSTPQRLDQNTSGLFIVATKKIFASYFAKLLRRKTDQQLSNSTSSDAIHKRYKCLLCLIEPYSEKAEDSWSVASAYGKLQSFVNDNTVLRHYLEPSIRAPKRFVTTQVDNSFAECLLRLTNVGELCPLVGSEAGSELAGALWNGDDSIPPGCVAVVEVEVELLTGRTHQIRGQLSTEGFPLVGDAQYGGAIPEQRESSHYIHSDRLALQCCQLEFLDPDVVVKDDGAEVMVPSDRWSTFRLDECWWTSLIDKYHTQAVDSATTSLKDVENVLGMQERGTVASVVGVNEHLLPPQVQLADGSHKYVLVKATNPKLGEHWFVKSAAPSECGGPYHANVAEELVEWLQAAGYATTIMGGGRIRYDSEMKEAFIFGFSYGFGKGDHEKAASIISRWDDTIAASYDNDDSLY